MEKVLLWDNGLKTLYVPSQYVKLVNIDESQNKKQQEGPKRITGKPKKLRCSERLAPKIAADKILKEEEQARRQARLQYVQKKIPLTLAAAKLAPKRYAAKMETGNGQECLEDDYIYEEVVDLRSVLFIGANRQAHYHIMALVRVAPDELPFSEFSTELQSQLIAMIKEPAGTLEPFEIENYSRLGPDADGLPTGDVYHSITPTQELIDSILSGGEPVGLSYITYYPWMINLMNFSAASFITLVKLYQGPKYDGRKSPVDLCEDLPKGLGRPMWVNIYPCWGAWLSNFYAIEMADECICISKDTEHGVDRPFITTFQESRRTLVEVKRSPNDVCMYMDFGYPTVNRSVAYYSYTETSRKEFEARNLGNDIYLSAEERLRETALTLNRAYDVRPDFIIEMNKSKCGTVPSVMLKHKSTVEGVRSMPILKADEKACGVPGCAIFYVKGSITTKRRHYENHHSLTHFKVQCRYCHHENIDYLFVHNGPSHTYRHLGRTVQCEDCLWWYTTKYIMNKHECPNPTRIRRVLESVVHDNANVASVAASSRVQDPDYVPPKSRKRKVRATTQYDKYVSAEEIVPMAEAMSAIASGSSSDKGLGSSAGSKVPNPTELEHAEADYSEHLEKMKSGAEINCSEDETDDKSIGLMDSASYMNVEFVREVMMDDCEVVYISDIDGLMDVPSPEPVNSDDKVEAWDIDKKVDGSADASGISGDHAYCQ